MPQRPSDLIELLALRVAQTPDKVAYRFLTDGESSAIEWSYRDLDRNARRVASALGSERRGQALLLYPPSLDYIAAFFGCLYAGVTAVPAYPPDPSRLQRTLPRLRAIAADSRADVLLTTDAVSKLVSMFGAQAPEITTCQSIATDTLTSELDEFEPATAGSDALAFLQYTSGSTSNPRGVKLSHGNLLHNLEMVRRGFELDESSNGVIWLPPYHDMGLIGGILQGLYTGFPITLFSPLAFLSRPMRWLEAIDRYRATVSGGPNFAFELCVRKSTPEQRASLDLSCWKVAFCGAEPIRETMLSEFSDAFATAGFDKKAFYPCYGLAEATLIVTGGAADKPPVVDNIDHRQLESGIRAPAGNERSCQLIGCGQALGDQEVVVVNPATRTLAQPGQVGEIWLCGPSVSSGYFNEPSVGDDPFRGHLAGTEQTDPSSFLRTGDLGYLQAGELFVTGRCKDLIIVRGRNIYPQDIERTLEVTDSRVRPGCSVAFASQGIDGQDGVVALVETRKGIPKDELAVLVETLAAEVNANHQLDLLDVAIVSGGTIPKTSSGKVQRSLARTEYESNQLVSVASLIANQQRRVVALSDETVAERSQMETLNILVDCVGQALNVAPKDVRIDQPLSSYGADSLQIVELQGEIRTRLERTVSLEVLFASPSILELTGKLEPIGHQTKPTSQTATTTDSVGPHRIATKNQDALWFLQRRDPSDRAAYISRAVRFDCAVDAQALSRAIGAITSRHESLRTSFALADDRLVRQVSENAQTPVINVDAISWSTEKLVEAMVAEASRSFELDSGPLFRVALYSTDQGTVMQWTAHHIVVDFVAVSTMFQEFASIYENLSEAATKKENDGVQTALGSALQFDDFVRAQTSQKTEKIEELEQFWNMALADAPASINLPFESRPTKPTESAGGTIEVNLPNSLARAIRKRADKERVTVSSIILAAYAATLARFGGDEDIVIGVPSTGRTRSEDAAIVGYCANMLPVRLQPCSNKPVTELIAQASKQVASALTHQQLPLSEIVTKLNHPRIADRMPLIQVAFSAFTSRVSGTDSFARLAAGVGEMPLELGQLRATPIQLPVRTSQFELSLLVAATTERIECVFEYATKRFSEATIRGLGRGFVRLLEEMVVSAPTTTLGTLLWAEVPTAKSRVVHQLMPSAAELFAQQVTSHPNDMALSFDGQSLSYAELDQRADELVGQLKTEVTSGPVGICMEQSVELVASMLACTKVGLPFVPIDPMQPKARQALFIDQAGIECVMSLSAGKARGENNPVETTVLTPQTPLPPDRSSSDIAYILFTSGSTGTPKGVMVSRSNLANRLAWGQSNQPIARGAAVLQFTSPSFDVSIWEVFSSLCFGGHLVVANQCERASVRALADLVVSHQIKMAGFVPSFLRVLVDEQGVSCLASLDYLFVGGEVLDRPLAVQLIEGLQNTSIYNFYGPTETTIDATFFELPRSAAQLKVIPIGNAVADALLYVLDDNRHPVPDGLIGRLFVGGPSVALGYCNAPKLTAERFISNPFVGDGTPMYDTGDLVRRAPSGELLFIGRNDHQVKVRGQRLELGEVESALRRHHAVSDVAVVLAPRIPRSVAEAVLDEIETLSEEAVLRLSVSTPSTQRVPNE